MNMVFLQYLHLDNYFSLLYINEMPNALKSSPWLFADDTSVILQHSDLMPLQNLLNIEIARHYEWCSVNQLTINTSKMQ